jgi:uncharacterized membrane protein
LAPPRLEKLRLARDRVDQSVSALLQLEALLTLTPIAAVLGAAALSAGDLGLGAVSGVVTSVAFLGFFTALAHGRMGVVLPVSHRGASAWAADGCLRAREPVSARHDRAGVVVLRERVHRWHAVGIALAFAGVTMVAAG